MSSTTNSDAGDPHDLQRFIAAQAPVCAQVCAELAAGAKTSHWMWFVFPQLAGLGRSATARRYGIGSRAEALAYARHPLLGARLVRCSELVLEVKAKTALQIFGSPDDLKLHSSMTLFGRIHGAEQPAYRQVLQRYFDGREDARTLELLSALST